MKSETFSDDATAQPSAAMIDLRSDTVTRPTPAMRKAMAEAEVGDDVYGEDPTVNRLEQRAAEIAGKEAALFVPTGTMGNVIGIKVHTEHGQEVICESRAHILDWELSMMAWFCGCLARPVESETGVLRWEQIRAKFRAPTPHNAPTGLIEVENSHNMGGGVVYPLEVLDEICEGAHAMGLPVHMDGARVFNAAAALGVPMSRVVENVDTVMFCLSKGLGAPVGSMLAGPKELMDKGRLYRKRLGGGMRQAGVLAAAGLIALEEMSKRLAEDHENARLLAERIARLPGLRLAHQVQTNIVIFEVTGTGMTPQQVVAGLRERGVLAGAVRGTMIRMVTHPDVSRADCESALSALAGVVSLAHAAR